MAAFEEPNSQTAKPNAGADQTKGDPDNTLWARLTYMGLNRHVFWGLAILPQHLTFAQFQAAAGRYLIIS